MHSSLTGALPAVSNASTTQYATPSVDSPRDERIGWTLYPAARTRPCALRATYDRAVSMTCLSIPATRRSLSVINSIEFKPPCRFHNLTRAQPNARLTLLVACSSLTRFCPGRAYHSASERHRHSRTRSRYVTLLTNPFGSAQHVPGGASGWRSSGRRGRPLPHSYLS